MQVARLGVHEEGGERLRVAPEQRVRQRHVTPVEPHEVQAHEEDGERVDEARGGVRAQRLAEQRAVGERELEVLGDEHGLEPLAVRVLSPGDDAHGDDARHLEPTELPEQLVLAVRDRLADLLDRDHPPGEADEPHDVPRDAAGRAASVSAGHSSSGTSQGRSRSAGSGADAVICRLCTVTGPLSMVVRPVVAVRPPAPARATGRVRFVGSDPPRSGDRQEVRRSRARRGRRRTPT